MLSRYISVSTAQSRLSHFKGCLCSKTNLDLNGDVLLAKLILIPEKCEDKWFGLHCRYRSHCLDQCDPWTGECIGRDKCYANWYGPSCQKASKHLIEGAGLVLMFIIISHQMFTHQLN